MSAPPAVVLRCHTGPSVGIGHLMRCREMARHLVAHGHDCVLLGPDPTLREAQDAALFAEWLAAPGPGGTPADAAWVAARAGAWGTRFAVIDDYRADAAYQAVLAGAGLRWLQQFDASLERSYRAPVLVNASPYERPEHYAGRLPDPATRLLFGPRHAVLRPEFCAVVPQPDLRPLRRVLLAFGGGDDRGMLAMGLDALAGRLAPEVTLELVAGRGNPNLEALAARVAALPAGRARLHVAPSGLAALIAACDLGVIAGGTMSYELAICGVPPVFVALAGNQINPCRGWQALTGAPFLGMAETVAPAALAAAVAELAADAPRRAAVARRGRAAVDGRGVARLCDALLEQETA